MTDQFGREVNYLRISLTEKCNFRCQYCMPDKPFSWVPKENLLSYEELFAFAKVCMDRGVNKIRITGGEPTLRSDLARFIKMLKDYKPSIDLSMTSNAYLLDKLALPLKEAGLDRVNISLDTLNKETAMKISQKDILQRVLNGIDACIEAGLIVKLNSVILKGINDADVLDLVEFARNKNAPIRFIEYMENHFAKSNLVGLSALEVKNIISKKLSFKDVGKDASAPAHYYELEDGYKFGIIEPHKEDFCKKCNRIRLTAEGLIVPCLYFDEGLSIREAMKNKDLPKAISILEKVLDTKPEKNKWSVADNETSNRAFYVTGG